MGYSAKTAFKRVDPNRWAGVYYRESDDKLWKGAPDICYYITFKQDSKKKWEKIGWKSEGYSPQVAADLRAERQRKARHGGAVKTAKEIRKDKEARNRPLDELAESYFEQRGGSAQAAKFDRYRYDKHVSPILGKKPVTDISLQDISRIKKNMAGSAPATIWGALELIRRIANYGKKAKLSPGLSFVIEMPKRNNEVVEHLSPEHVARLLEVLDNWPSPDVSRMLKVAMFSGMRRGEIFKLEDRDIDFRNDIVSLRDPKSGEDCTIPLNPMLAKIFRQQMAWRDEKFPGSHFIFPGRWGGQRVDSNAVDRIKAKAELPRSFRIFHGLRHHYAVTLANSGEFTLDMIGELLTHKDATMTRRYAQFLPGAKKKAADRAAELIQGAMAEDERTKNHGQS